MSRSDIKRKFDQIVDFAEVEKFFDIPVKHFSSGIVCETCLRCRNTFGTVRPSCAATPPFSLNISFEMRSPTASKR